MRVKISGTVGSGAFGFGFSCASAGMPGEQNDATRTSVRQKEFFKVTSARRECYYGASAAAERPSV
jgi:hypothetical protein